MLHRSNGRTYFRRRREHREATVWRDEQVIDYDAAERMRAIDRLERPWRDLVNEHGYVPVVKALREASTLPKVREILRQRHENRQRQLANGSV
jgi:hypothetical protein